MNADKREITELLGQFDPDQHRHDLMLDDAPVGSETGSRTMTAEECAECERLTRELDRDVAEALKDKPIRRGQMPHLDDPETVEKIDALCCQLWKYSNESLAEVHGILRDAGLSRSAAVIDEARGHIHNAITTLRRRQFEHGRNTGLSEAALLADNWGDQSAEGGDGYHNLAKAIREMWR